jgi:hypothetical protein
MDEQPDRLQELAKLYRRIARKMSDPDTIEALQDAADSFDRRARQATPRRFLPQRRPH